MRVRLVQNLHLDGAVRLSGSVVEEDGELCESWIARGIAVLDEPTAVVAGFFETESAFIDAVDDAIAEHEVAEPVAVDPASVVIETRAQRKARERAEREAKG